MTTLPRLIGYQVIDVTTGEPSRGETEVLSEAVAIAELIRLRSHPHDQMKMVAIFEGDLDCYVGESGPVRLIT